MHLGSLASAPFHTPPRVFLSSSSRDFTLNSKISGEIKHPKSLFKKHPLANNHLLCFTWADNYSQQRCFPHLQRVEGSKHISLAPRPVRRSVWRTVKMGGQNGRETPVSFCPPRWVLHMERCKSACAAVLPGDTRSLLVRTTTSNALETAKKR